MFTLLELFNNTEEKAQTEKKKLYTCIILCYQAQGERQTLLLAVRLLNTHFHTNHAVLAE